jgi:hypothetical protein
LPFPATHDRLTNSTISTRIITLSTSSTFADAPWLDVAAAAGGTVIFRDNRGDGYGNKVD